MLEAGVVEQKIAELEAAVKDSSVIPLRKRG
jgi:hypothetical protein